MTCFIISPERRKRLLYPGRWGIYGNNDRRFFLAWRMKRASESNPSSDWITASVTNSASDSFGVISTAGRSGTQCGFASSRSSILVYNAVTRVSKSGTTESKSWGRVSKS